MKNKITKAVITAAGLGTRMLPISKAVTKEMLPIVDKPAIEYLVDEAVQSGITDILIITNRGKECIENYFDYVPEYEEKFSGKSDSKNLSNLSVIRASAEKANIFFLRQKVTKGLGHAVFCAKSFVGNEDFLVMYGDDIIISDYPNYPAAHQLIETYENHGGDISVCGVNKVSKENLKKYCSLKIESVENRTDEFYVYDMIEKPQTDEEIFSDYAILGRVILTPEIFDILENQTCGYNGEIQLTDAMKKLVLLRESTKKAKMIAKEFVGERHDMGSKFGFLRANVMEAVKHGEVAEEFKAFLTDFVKKL